MAPYVQQRLGIEPSTTLNLDSNFYDAAAIMVLIGSFAVMLGSHFGIHKKILVASIPRVISQARANILSIGAIFLFLYVGLKIGFGSFFLNRSDYVLARMSAWPDSSITAMVTGGLNMSLLVAVVAQIQLRKNYKALGTPAPRFLPAITTLALFIAVNPFNSPRYVFGTVILAIFATLGASATLIRYRIFSASAIVGMVLVFPLADAFRRSSTANIRDQGPIMALTSGDFDAFAQIVNTLDFVSSNGILWGRQFIGVILFWMPRSFWPEKPIDTGTVLAEYKGYAYQNLSSPIWSELFINGGWVALVIGMFLIGYYLRRLDQKTEIALVSSAGLPILASILPFYLLIILRGSLLNAASYFLVIILCSWFVTRKAVLIESLRPFAISRAPR
ncbi:oligosaccharide repeat unit polymerase [Arthrobacter sp. SDTb3-6]|uniref:oligosaccharide repeat unit polymerase n=1 Tax=Arthrobacter sp. SDTb3-6 TaxID=2713571 RepID=UPI00159D1D9D|nr:oligosaccharide repeat unit polymerase [Arthrobacter sp. SDTb3-6]NVN00099.1 oligosaccharide repeat unit polymerase [Arthrobacter sp. SDTb3-6]